MNETNHTTPTSRRIVKRFGFATRLLAIFSATALGFQAYAADVDLGLSFNGDGGNDTQAGTITVNITGDAVTLTGTDGAQTVALYQPSRDAFPTYVSGSFTIDFEALGTVAENFDSVDFTGGLADGVFSSANEWAVNSDINALANTIIGQGLAFTFDFSNLTGANGVNLSGVRMNNDGDGARVNFLANGTSVSTDVYNGGGAVGGNVTQIVSQALATGDKISFHTGDTGNPSGNGQVRLLEFIFDFLPTTILQPILTASVGIDQTVVLDWDDDFLGLATSYEVYRSTTSGSYGAPITILSGGTFASEYTDTGLTNGTTYFYQVVATDGASPATSNEVQATPVISGSSIYVHYDASNVANVTLVNTNEVTGLSDLSGNNYNADVGGASPGTVLYPDATPSTLGLDLLDMGATRNMLRTLLPGDQDALLDFNGDAAASDGFSFFVVARVDSLLGGGIRDVVLANRGDIANGFMLRLQGGAPELYLDGVKAEIASPAPVAGDTLVIAANYDKATGNLEFWNSKAGASVNVTVPAGDFSEDNAIFLGGSTNGGQYMDGAIGEVKFYQGKMTTEEFAAEQVLLVEKWLKPAPILGNTLYAHYDATDAGSVSFATANEVSIWADQTVNAFDAATAGGGDPILYPSASVSSYGINGLDVPASADSTLIAFTSAQQDAWLDFSSGGEAEAYSGFAIFAVVKPDAVGVTSDVVFANNGNPGGVAESLSLRYQAGVPTIYIGGNDYTRSTVVAAGETVVLALNYDSGTGELTFWDSESGSSGVATVTAADFSSVQNMYIAGDLNPGHGMDGLFGELKVYRGTMTPAEFEAERDALMAKWVQNAPINVTAESVAGDINLAWEDPNPTVSDTYSVYRSESSGIYTTAIASGLTTTNYTDTTGVLGTTYYYVLTATRDSNESAFSDEVFEATFAASAVYAHYDASDAANVTLANTNEVTALADLSGNGYNADVGGDLPGTVLYPDASPSATGLDILDMGTGRNILRTLIPGAQDALLDFNGTAAGNSGFSFFVVTRVDALLDGVIRDVILANRGDITAGLHLRFQGGSPELFVGGVKAEDTSAVPVAGDTLVIAANYNKVTGQLEFWNSKANASVTVSVSAGDFSEGNAIFLGGSNGSGQYMDGAIGEVKFYQGRMSAAAFAAEQLALTEKWITGGPSTNFATWVDGTFANGTLTDKTATGDDDKDGISNLIEFAIEGEDPTVSNSTVGDFTGLTLSFSKRQEVPAVGGITYAIEQSTDLGVTDTWEAVTPTVDDLNSISYTLPGAVPKDFVRLKVTQD
ncbi:MAG: hypothetical protein ABF330_12090 [Lentimonas sp.]